MSHEYVPQGFASALPGWTVHGWTPDRGYWTRPLAGWLTVDIDGDRVVVATWVHMNGRTVDHADPFEGYDKDESFEITGPGQEFDAVAWTARQDAAWPRP